MTRRQPQWPGRQVDQHSAHFMTTAWLVSYHVTTQDFWWKRGVVFRLSFLAFHFFCVRKIVGEELKDLLDLEVE